MLKKIGRRLALSLFVPFLILLLLVTTLLSTLRPEKIKGWMSKSGIYKVLPDAVINKTQENQKKNQGDQPDSFSPSNPGFQAALKKTLSPQFLQSSSEQIVTGTFHWLDGKTTQPDFSIDLVPVKQQFADEMAAYAKNRYLQLPACAPRQRPTSTDPLEINCRVAGYDINQEIAKFKTKIVSDKGFLPKSNLSPQTLTSEKNGTQQSVFADKNQIPQHYQQARMAPWIILAVLVGLAAIIVYCSDTKLAGLRRLGLTLLVVGVLSGFGLWLSYIVIGALKQRLPAKISEVALRDASLNFADAVRHDFTTAAGKITALYIVLGAGMLIIHHFMTRSQKPTKPDSHHEALKTTEEKPESDKDAKPAPPTPKT